jgi:hypothetical protein
MLHARLALMCCLLACDGTQASGVVDADTDAAIDAAVDAPRDAAPDAPRDTAVPVDLPPRDIAPPRDFGPLPMAVPLPASVKPPQRFLPPADRLAGIGSTACSDVATGDRWCVFARRGATEKLAELWVINLSKSAAGNVPRCDGSSADCVRLSSTLWTGFSFTGPAHPFSHEFYGDALFFYADSTSGSQEHYQGPVQVWRPGWTQPRVITSPKAMLCFGHYNRPLAFCIDALEGDPSKPDSFELRAGPLDAAGALPSVGRINPFRTGGAVAWGAGFSPDGQLFAVSSPEADVEVLRVVPTAEIGRQPPREILRGATSWGIGYDSKRIYYYRPEGDDLHGLYVADFPAGSGEVKLGGSVRDYLILGDGTVDQGVAFLAAVEPDLTAFRYVRDSRAAAVTVFSYRGLLEGVIMSGDLRYTAWLDARFNARVVRHADLASCRLNVYAPTAAYSPEFFASAGLVFWSEDAPDLDIGRDGFFARPDDCTSPQRFARGIAYYVPIGDRGLLYADESDAVGHANLKYAAARQNATALETPVRVHDKVEESSFILIGSPPAYVIYNTPGADGGTWVFGPLPF